MSRYEWESGKFTLPTAAVPQFKAVLRERMNTHHEQVRKEAIRLHKTIKTSSPTKYRKALWELQYNTHTGGHSSHVSSDAFLILSSMLHQATADNKAPHQPTVADVSRVAAKYTNRDNVFHDGELTISFDGRVVTYDVMENNHACDTANDSPLGSTFWSLMNKVTWTRGTGGHTVGCDEYARDTTELGGGANYLVRAYGPLGEQVRRNYRGY